MIRLAAWTVFDSDFPIGLSLVPRAHSSVLGQRAWPQKLNHEMGKAREQRNLYLGNGLSCPLPVIASRIAIPRDPSASCSRRPARYFLGCRDWGRETQAEGDLQVVSVVVLAALSYLLLELTAFVLKSLWAPLFPKLYRETLILTRMTVPEKLSGTVMVAVYFPSSSSILVTPASNRASHDLWRFG